VKAGNDEDAVIDDPKEQPVWKRAQSRAAHVRQHRGDCKGLAARRRRADLAVLWLMNVEMHVGAGSVGVALDGVKQDGRSNDIHLGRRIDSSDLLPLMSRCLT